MSQCNLCRTDLKITIARREADSQLPWDSMREAPWYERPAMPDPEGAVEWIDECWCPQCGLLFKPEVVL